MDEIKIDNIRKPHRLHASARRISALRFSKRPIYIFTHHKTGTVLFTSIFRALSLHLNLSMCRAYGYFEYAPQYDIVVFEHSLVSERIFDGDYVGVHVRRDPREVLASSYLYHLRTKEKWCTHQPDRSLEKNDYTSVDHIRSHYSEDWKNRFISGLGGQSYQSLLRRLDREAGLIFELNNYSGWTIQDMLAWEYRRPRIKELRLEDVAENFQTQIMEMLQHVGLSEQYSSEVFALCKKYDIANLAPGERARNKHISGEIGQKWPNLLSNYVLEQLDEKFPKAAERLGYSSQ